MEFGKSDHFLSWMGDIIRHSPPVVCVLIIVIKQIQIDIQNMKVLIDNATTFIGCVQKMSNKIISEKKFLS